MFEGILRVVPPTFRDGAVSAFFMYSIPSDDSGKRFNSSSCSEREKGLNIAASPIATQIGVYQIRASKEDFDEQGFALPSRLENAGN